ncbi:hypothetical protein IJ00_09540 [Calothrix sp. 336/3]|nr:hypothetical protein IJ00_09540 [Calothrix sp. 336/3]
MEIKCFPLLGTLCKRLMLKRKSSRQYGKKRKYHYRPQKRLINRLANELKMSPQDVERQIFRERLHLLRELYGQENISEADV